jgi:hypothetical protein
VSALHADDSQRECKTGGRVTAVRRPATAPDVDRRTTVSENRPIRANPRYPPFGSFEQANNVHSLRRFSRIGRRRWRLKSALICEICGLSVGIFRKRDQIVELQSGTSDRKNAAASERCAIFLSPILLSEILLSVFVTVACFTVLSFDTRRAARTRGAQPMGLLGQSALEHSRGLRGNRAPATIN